MAAVVKPSDKREILVTKRELLDLVWRDVSVEEGVLSVYVSALRRSLGGSVEGTGYIETVPRAGYRFSAGVTRREARAEPLSMKWHLLHDLQHMYNTRGREGVVEFTLRVSWNSPPFHLALLHGEAGRLDEAFRHLDAAIAQRDPALVHLAVAPQWDCLRGDARFAERLEVMGLAAAAERAQRFRP